MSGRASTTGTPASVGPGIVVRIRMSGGHSYTSKRMTRDAAASVAEGIKETFRRFTGLVDLPQFPDDTLEELSLVADQVQAVELRCVNGDGALWTGPTPATPA